MDNKEAHQEEEAVLEKKEKKTGKLIRRFQPMFKVMLAVALLSAVLTAMALSPLLGIRNVLVTGNQIVSTDKVFAMAGQPVGKNLILYKKKEAIEKIESHPYVEKVSIRRQFPYTLRINIKERRPVGVLVNNDNYLQFSDGGLLLDSTNSLQSFGIPIISGISLKAIPQPGEQIRDAGFQDVLKIVNAMSDDLLKMVQEVNIAQADNILAYTSNGIEIRIGNADQINERMAALQDIMKQLILTDSIKGEIDYIDMRSAKAPVIKMKNPEDAMDSEGKPGEQPGQPSASREAQPIGGTTEPVESRPQTPAGEEQEATPQPAQGAGQNTPKPASGAAQTPPANAPATNSPQDN